MKPDDLEALALHSALYDEPEPVLAAIDDGTFSAALFVDPIGRATAEAIIDVVLAGSVPEPHVVAVELECTGLGRAAARDAVLLVGTFQAAGCRCGGLGHYLFKLAEERDRRDLELQLLAMAETLHKPGGPARVAELLGAAR